MDQSASHKQNPAVNRLTDMMRAYLIERDVEKTMSYFTEDVQCIGTGIQEVAFHKEQLRDIMMREIQNDPLPFELVFQQILPYMLSEDLHSVYVVVQVNKTLPSGLTISAQMRQTSILRKIEGDYYVQSLHVSVPSAEQDGDECYPIKSGQQSISAREIKMNSKLFLLINEMMPSGMMGQYNEPGYPLYFINDQLLSYLGYSYEEFIQRTQGDILNCIHPDDRDLLRRTMIDSFSHSDCYTYTYRMIKKDGSIIYISSRGKKLQTDDGREAIVSVCMDITSQMEREDELTSVALGNLGGIFKARMDDTFTVLFANDSYYALHGYTKEQMQKEINNEAIQVVHPDDLQRISQQLHHAMESKKSNVSFEYRIIRRDGKIIWLLMSAGFSETPQGTMLSGMVIDITQRKEMEQQLRWSEERFQIAISQTDINVWEYDIVNRRVIQSAKSQEVFGFGKCIENVPDSLIQDGFVHPDSIRDFLSMYDALFQGAKTASCVARLRSPDSHYHWRKINYTTIFDENGAPIRAVAVSADISAQKYAEHRFIQEEQLREMLSVDVLMSIKVNLSANSVVNFWSKNECPHDLLNVKLYTELYRRMGIHIANNEDRKRYQEAFNLPALWSFFRSGEQSFSAEFRCADLSGGIIWTSFHITMLTDPETGDLIMFICIQDIDKRKKMELALRERAEKDAVTGLYNKFTIESMIQGILKHKRKQDGQCALFIVDLDNFKQVNDQHGHLYGDKVLKEIGHILHSNLQKNSLAGRIGGDEFLVFLEEISGEQQAFCQAENLCKLLHLSYPTGEIPLKVTCSIGISIASYDQAQFETMFQEADSALYNAKKHGKAQYISYQNQTYYQNTSEMLTNSCIAQQHSGLDCMLDELNQMIFIIDYETYDMLYMNAMAKNEFGISGNDYFGRKCYKLLQGFSQPCIFCQNHQPDEDGFKCWENRNVKLHKRFSIQGKIIQWDGRPARLELYTPHCNQDAPDGQNSADRLLLESAGFLLSAQTIDIGIDGILERLGRFYCADRCYFVRTNLEDAGMYVTYEWLDDTACTESNSSLPYNDNSDWIEHLCKKHVVVYHDLEPLRSIFPVKYFEMKRKNVRAFYAVALLEKNQLYGYVGIENPREHLDATTMLLSISYFLLSEIIKRNMQKEHAFNQTHDFLTGCLNWSSYDSYLFQISNEVLSSLGVLYTDINHLGDLNYQYGKNYGNRLIKFIASCLQDEFGQQSVYRLAGDKFVVFREDITYDKFIEKVERSHSLIEEQYPRCVSFGYTWADEDIFPEQMLKHAAESLMAEKQMLNLGGEDRKHASMLKILQTALKQKRFHIYLQPKAEVSTGKIKGAEALIRYMDDQYGVIPPGKFIPQLEEAGLIRYIDFFVLEEVCKTLQRWKRNGFPLFPISLNFSRATLLEKDVVCRINQISDHYGVDRSLLEIEITESIGDMERRILSDISEAIIQDGYRLSLDDFGSKYSNLAILSSLQLSELKIDKSIINDLYSNPNTRLVVENLIHICRQLGIDSVAEGVEEQEQLQVLSSMGCTYAQGYLYNKPIPVKDFERKYIHCHLMF